MNQLFESSTQSEQMKSLSIASKQRGLITLYFFLWIMLVLIVSEILHIPEDKLQLPLVFILLYGYTGYLTSDLLRLHQEWSPTQTFGLAFGLGIGEALILGQIAVLLHLPTGFLAYTVTALALLKIILLWRRHNKANFSFRLPDWPLIVQIGIALIGLLILLNNARFHGVYTFQPSDTWNYLRVQAHFPQYGEGFNFQEGITAHSINVRLYWNSWLYNRAMVDHFSHIDPVISHQRDGGLPLYFVAMLVYAALGRELLGDPQAAWLAVALQVGLLISATEQSGFFTQRIVEDKFFSYFVFIPLAYIPLVRMLQRPTGKTLTLFSVLALSASLIHPMNPVMLFITLVPVLVLHSIVQRKWIQIRWMLLLAVIITTLLIIPLSIQLLVSNTPSGNTVVSATTVGEAIEQSRKVDWTYTVGENVPFNWDTALVQSDIQMSAIILIPLIGFAWFRKPTEPALVFLVATSMAIISFLWIPPFAALGAMLLTRSQNWRIFMLMPMGYAWAWLALAGWRFTSERLLLSDRAHTFARVVWGTIPLLLAVIIWQWPDRMPNYNQSSGLNRLEITALNEIQNIVGDEYILSTERFSRIIPVILPDSRTAYIGEAERAIYIDGEVFNELMGILHSPLDTDPVRTLKKYGIEYVLLSQGEPLSVYLTATPDCCVTSYENDMVVLYRILDSRSRIH